MSDNWLSVQDLADELGIPKQTIYRWRTEGEGPRAHIIGRHVRFSRESVDAWLDSLHEPHPGAWNEGVDQR